MDNKGTDKTPHHRPLPINTTFATHSRHRSGSLSSDSSSDGSPSDPIQTPLSLNSPKVTAVSPSTSPLFSIFRGQQSASATCNTFPFRRSTVDSIGSNGPVFDDGPLSTHISPYYANVEIDETTQGPDTAPIHKIGRRATTSWTAAPQMHSVPGNRQERASGLLRRLSLSTSFSKVRYPFQNFMTPLVTLRYHLQQDSGINDQPPAVPPNTALPNSPTNNNTLANGRNSPPRKPVRRAPSPMGERILKGHFDGFN